MKTILLPKPSTQEIFIMKDASDHKQTSVSKKQLLLRLLKVSMKRKLQ